MPTAAQIEKPMPLKPTTIALNQLTAWEGNMRRSVDRNHLDELKASILAHGVLQSLNVIDDGGKLKVIAGKRRLTALSELAKEKKIAGDYDVPVILRADKNKADEISLAENVVRQAMHPADQAEAFAKLAKTMKPADIAPRFGVTETVVKKRLKLANLAPEVMAEFRDDKISIEQAQAFAASDDHAKQKEILEGGRRDEDDGTLDLHPGYIRRTLTEGRIRGDDRRVQFVTLAAYEKAGGKVERDLFTEGDDGAFILDEPLLNKLTTEKLAGEIAKVKAEGWGWVKMSMNIDKAETDKLKQGKCEFAPIPKKDQEQIDALRKEEDKIIADSEDRPYTDQESERLQQIEDLIDKLETTPEVWEKGFMASAGAFVGLNDSGEVEIERGWIEPKEDKKLQKAAKDKADALAPAGKGKAADTKAKGESADRDDDEAPALTKDLIEELTAHRTAAQAAVLADRPAVALPLVAHALGSSLFYHEYGGQVLNLTAKKTKLPKSIHDGGGSHAANVLKAKVDALKLPKKHGDFLEWCLSQLPEDLDRFIALCAACMYDATVYAKPSTYLLKGDQDASLIVGRALGLDMSEWFTANAANYFGRINRAAGTAALSDALKVKESEIPAAWKKLKKAEFGPFLEREIHAVNKKWLPELLRFPGPVVPVKAIDLPMVTTQKQAAAMCRENLKQKIDAAPKAKQPVKVVTSAKKPAAKKTTAKPVAKNPAAKPAKKTKA